MEDSQGIIRRKSLGRVAFIGSLYNASKDTFCGATILKFEFPNDSISRVDVSNDEFLYDYKDSYVEKFNKLDVEDELRLSILAGLFTLEGSGKYLNDMKETFKSVKGALIYKITSIEENLDIHRDDVKTCISTDGFNNDQGATHIVIGIKWGATVIASFEYNGTDEENRTQVEETLRSQIEKITISKEGYMNVEGQSDIMSRFSIKLLGDIVPDDKEFPKSFDEARKVISELPSYIKKYNDGKGVPIEYTLYPLTGLAKLITQNFTFNNAKTELSKETILKIERFFDSLSESKQRLNDLYNDAKSISYLIPEKIFDEVKNRVQEITLGEAKFKDEFAECLFGVRSGKININELECKMEIFQESNLSTKSIMTFIDHHQLISLKANLLKSKKVEYLDENLDIEKILHKYSNNHVFILIDDNNFIVDDNSLSIYYRFRDLCDLNEGLNKFFMADTKICTEINHPIIQHYINGKLVSNDYYNDNKILFTSNLVKFDSLPRINPKFNPNEKIKLLVPCPRVDCQSINCNWRCYKCQQDIEYGYNQHFYCGCGESEIANCRFKCNSSHHIEGYIPFKLNTLIGLLPSEAPEEINILLLGETGVGKSTFINAFANYLKFETLVNAKSGDMVELISSIFTITDENYDTQTIRIGDNDSNEQLENVGMSCTLGCKSYVFHTPENNKLIRLIDTPGVGDTRGLDQDKKNFENILNFISHFQYLNGICILLKPNNSRLTVVFKFCIQELLLHLHKNAKENIVFCFTNARGTFYRPGDTLPPLKIQLKELEKRSNVEIKVNQDTLYCFDNESFRFLAAIKKGISFTDTDEQSFAESWKRSRDESLRLIEYIVTRYPHKVKDTLSLNNSRNLAILLSRPLAKMEQLIQTNINQIEEQQKELADSNQTIEELKEKMYIKQLDLEPVSLTYPRTVCTSNSCIELLRVEKTNIQYINYKKHCDPRCYIPFARFNVMNQFLWLCGAMNSKGTCNVCNCEWSKHKHITYENRPITKIYIDLNVEWQIFEEKSCQEIKEKIIEKYQARVNELKKEKETMNKICVKFAQFLRQNAIATFNDTYIDYLDLFINEEKIKKGNDPELYDDRILKGLEETKKSYLEQIKFIKQAINNNDPSISPISPEDIVELEQQLYNLPINGSTLKKIKEEAENSQINAFKYKENHCMLLGNDFYQKLLLKTNALARLTSKLHSLD
jgi:GTPase SAR1 family protein